MHGRRSAPAVAGTVAVLAGWIGYAAAADSPVSATNAAPQPPPGGAEDGAKAPPLPIEIEAAEGIEWFRDQQVVYARGNAKAVRGDLVVTADVLGARYRDRADGGQEVWQLDAAGTVKITTPGQTVLGDSGVYDLDTGVLLLYGKPARMISGGGDTISANDELEYATKTQVIVARGDAAATQGDRLIRANELTAFLQRQPDGGSKLQRIEAETNVRVITPKDVILGNRGVYNAIAGTATVTGNVRITRGTNQLNGCRGEMDFNSGVSRLLACGENEPPVRGLILPGAAGAGRPAAPR